MNIKWQGVPLTLKSSNNTVENYSVTHVHTRDAISKWTWSYSGSGLSGAVSGRANVLTNGILKHSWNNGLSTEQATGVNTFDGVFISGSPNHCSVGWKQSSIIRNFKVFNCQDYQWSSDVSNMVIENSVIAGSGIALEAVTKALGPITVRNSILHGDFAWVRGLPERCTWEAGSVIENNVMHASATIEHCDGKTVTKAMPHAEYIAKCEAGIYSGCAVFRGNRYVTDWATVLKGGWYKSGDSWDTTPIPGGPALDVVTTSTLFAGPKR
jgi:hypothetical protein